LPDGLGRRILKLAEFGAGSLFFAGNLLAFGDEPGRGIKGVRLRVPEGENPPGTNPA